jgi:hypothetical protein
MSDENPARDPFKPEQPRIPGVPDRLGLAGNTAVPSARLLSKFSRLEMPPRWLTIAILAAVLAGMVVAWCTR